MTEKIIISLEEIKNTPINLVTSVKIFLISIVLIPWAFLVHLFFTLLGMINIPGNVIDVITIGEKTKILIRSKKSANV